MAEREVFFVFCFFFAQSNKRVDESLFFFFTAKVPLMGGRDGFVFLSEELTAHITTNVATMALRPRLSTKVIYRVGASCFAITQTQAFSGEG